MFSSVQTGDDIMHFLILLNNKILTEFNSHWIIKTINYRVLDDTEEYAEIFVVVNYALKKNFVHSASPGGKIIYFSFFLQMTLLLNKTSVLIHV